MTDSERWVDAVIRNRHPMQPLQTDVVARLTKLHDIKAVIFDVYGTLVVSGSGDVGSADTTDPGDHLSQAIDATGWKQLLRTPPTVEGIRESIQEFNQQRVSQSCPKPEVDIVEVWRQVLTQCGWDLAIDMTSSVVGLAAEYESRANPTWPMPGARELLQGLQASGMPMGIVSNAQVFTPILVEDLLEERDLRLGGFDLDLCLFSNRFRQAKPGPRLFEVLRTGLASRQILPREAIYVGNDMLNDVWAASESGFRTAWFAGDARSCRPRHQDPRCGSLQPDLVLTDLLQLLECLQIK